MKRSFLIALLLSSCALTPPERAPAGARRGLHSFDASRMRDFDWVLQTEDARGRDVQCASIPECAPGQTCDFSRHRVLGRDLDTLLARCPERARNFVSHGGDIVCYFGYGVTHDRDVGEETPSQYVYHYRKGKLKTCGRLTEWPDNILLDFRGSENKEKLRVAHHAIIDSAREFCTAYEPDVMDGYQYTVTDPTNKKRQIPAKCGVVDDFVAVAQDLCRYAKNAGEYAANAATKTPIGCIQKNSPAMVERLADLYDGQIVEECLAHEGDCAYSRPFLARNKGVVDREYGGTGSTVDGTGIMTRKEFQAACARYAADIAGMADVGMEATKEVYGNVIARCPRP